MLYICYYLITIGNLHLLLWKKLDNLDRQILEIISQNARIPFKDVAAECGVSRAAIHQRVQRLIDLGVIVGSGYHVNRNLWDIVPVLMSVSNWKKDLCIKL